MTTESDDKRASSLAKKLLKKNLIACISIQKVRSLYWWNDQIEDRKEVQIIAKTSKSKLTELKKEIILLHSYDNPEIIYWPISSSKAYYDWVNKVVL